MYSYIIIGAPRTGKSYMLKEKLGKANPESIWLYDENEEYEFYTKPFVDEVEFTEKAKSLRNAIIVWEEATTFVNHSPDPVIKKMLALKFHQKNTHFFVFHSFRDVPQYVWNKSSHVVIFKTNDSLEFINTRFRHPEVNKAAKEVKESEWIMTGKNYPGTSQEIKYSIHKIVSIYGIPD